MPPEERYVLRLFVAGMSDRSREAVQLVGRLCETRLRGRYELHVVDVHQQPELVRESRIVATPALVRESPQPVRRFFGNLGDEAAICAGLGLPAADPAGGAEPGCGPPDAVADGLAPARGRPEGRSDERSAVS